MVTQNRHQYSRTRRDVDFQFFGSPNVLHATGEQTDDRFCLMEHVMMPPGVASPYHRHHNEDETFYVLDGHVRFVCDGEWADAGPGHMGGRAARDSAWFQGGGDAPRADG